MGNLNMTEMSQSMGQLYLRSYDNMLMSTNFEVGPYERYDFQPVHVHVPLPNGVLWKCEYCGKKVRETDMRGNCPSCGAPEG